MSGVEVQGSLKEALYETLNGILETERENRQVAEQRLTALEVTEEFGIHLTEIVVNPSSSLSIRQLASVLLQQYIQNHWCSLSEKFHLPEIKPDIKERIKILLPLGLYESISKVRNAVAYVISRIAHWDWPENWPGLFDILVNCLSGENNFAVHGAMQVLIEFTRDLADTHLPKVGPVILQEMYQIIQSDTQYLICTRGSAVEIFTTISGLFGETGMYNLGLIEEYLLPMIPMFCEKFVHYLNVPNGPISDSCLKTEVIKSINCLILKLSKYMVNFVPRILPSVWITLTQIAKTYQEEIVNGTCRLSTEVVDCDEERMNFNNLIIALFEFVSTLVDHKRYCNHLNNFLPDVMYYIILFTQVTTDQIELWSNNPNQFIEEDDNCANIYNVRIAAQELLGILLTYSEVSVNSLCNAIERHIESVRTSLFDCIVTDPSHVWKIYEACIVSLNTAKDAVIEQQTSGKLEFDIIRFMNSVVLPMLNSTGVHPLLLGRCLCLAGRYAKELPLEINSKFLEASVNGLLEIQPICIRLSSLKAIYWFCQIASEENILLDILRPHLLAIFEALFILVNQPLKEIVILVMEAFSMLIPLDKTFTTSIETKICPFTIAVFLKFNSDPEILHLCEDIFKELSENSDCVGPLQNRLIPTLINMMNITTLDKLKDEGIRGIALDVLEVLVQYSPQPLSKALVESAFPTACHCILDSSDNGTLQSGGEVIRTYLLVAAHQVIMHTDNEGRTGLNYILQIIAQLLNPQSSEFTATFVGRLVITLFRKVGNSLGESLDHLLKAVLSKMQRIETPTVMQSLLMIYAHLINSQFDGVLNFLTTVPGPTGESALNFVLTEWVNKQQLFFGNYDRKVSTVALSKILEYGVTRSDSRLNEIIVDGDLIYAENDLSSIRTRGKCQLQPLEWTRISILIKIFKLLVYELEHYLELHSASQETEESDDEADTESKIIIDPGANVNFSLIDNYGDVSDTEDYDMQQDSFYHLNIGEYLRDFLQNFSTHHDFAIFSQHLSLAERKVLKNINIFKE